MDIVRCWFRSTSIVPPRAQLQIVAKAIGTNLYEGDLKGEEAGPALVERLAKEARREAIISGCDVMIVDTAGRLHIDEGLMSEMQRLKSLLNPQEILFVADAMTGQDAVRSAKEFHDRLALTGTVLTKMDGDARGGAALSIRHVTGQPIKFIGMGEKPDAFEPFHPDRIVSRILGMGDIMTLIEKAEEHLDRKKSEELAKKALLGDGFSLEDFREQLRQIKKMGSLQSIMKMLPSVGPFQGMQQAAGNVDEKQFTRIEAIINSMTAAERKNHELISGSRRKRIARGSGTSVQEVNQMLRQYVQMRKMFKSMGRAAQCNIASWARSPTCAAAASKQTLSPLCAGIRERLACQIAGPTRPDQRTDPQSGAARAPATQRKRRRRIIFNRHRAADSSRRKCGPGIFASRCEWPHGALCGFTGARPCGDQLFPRTLVPLLPYGIRGLAQPLCGVAQTWRAARRHLATNPAPK